jgi:hypothetical protein
MPQLQSKVIKLMSRKWDNNPGDKGNIPAVAVNYVYENTKPDSGLRQAVRDICVWGMGIRKFKESKGAFYKEFLEDFGLRQMERAAGKLPRDPPKLSFPADTHQADAEKDVTQFFEWSADEDSSNVAQAGSKMPDAGNPSGIVSGLFGGVNASNLQNCGGLFGGVPQNQGSKFGISSPAAFGVTDAPESPSVGGLFGSAPKKQKSIFSP